MLLFSQQSVAEHIMGGNVDFRYVGGDRYRLGVRVVIDCEHSNEVAWYENDGINIGMYSKTTNQLVDQFLVQLMEGKGEEVKPTRDDCDLGITFCMMVLSYYDTLEFDPQVYTDEAGYYFSWERCCRNKNVVNIVNPDETGIAFYAEVPPFSIRNSLPRVRNIPLTLLCNERLFNYDFKVSDPDGDDLKVTLTEPLQGGTNSNKPNDWNVGKTPRLEPGPYAAVTWKKPFGKDATMLGNPDLTVDEATGRVSVKPGRKGTFAFALKVEEYRDDILLGHMIMEMQFSVEDCKLNPPPQLDSELDGKTFEVYPNQKFLFSTTVKDSTDSVFVSMEGELFDPAITGDPRATYTTTSGHKIAKVTVLWRPSCEQIRDEPYHFIVNAADNGCPLPSYARADMYVKVLEPPILEAPNLFCIERINDEDLLIQWEHDFGFAYGGVILEEDVGNGWTLIDTIRDKGTRSYLHNAPGNSDENFCYRIRTINQCEVVADAAVEYCSLDDIGVVPDKVLLSNVTVNEDEHVEIVWTPNTDKDFDRYLLYKSRNEDGFLLFRSIKQRENATYVDSFVNADSNAYKYYLQARDDCSLLSESSDIASTILLRESSSSYRDSLYWTMPELWSPTNFDLRGLSSPSQSSLIVAVNDLQYLHEIEERGDGIWSYRVQANHSNGELVSYSNTVEIVQKPSLWIPNVFSPNGDKTNPEWAIHADFFSDYHLRIFNRWGQEVFETTNPLEFWKGEGATESSYLYIFNCRSLSGEIIFKTGSVVVIR